MYFVIFSFPIICSIYERNWQISTIEIYQILSKAGIIMGADYIKPIKNK